MERRLKQVIFSKLMEIIIEFGMIFSVSRIILKLLLQFDQSKYFMVSNFRSETDIMVGLLLLYILYFSHLLYKKIDTYIFDEVDRLIRSIKENSYKYDYKTYEFQKISEVLNKKKEEIIEKDQALIKGISFISHDMKTPITVINTNIALIKNSNDKIAGKNLERLDRVFEESDKISTYIDEIMKIAKSQLEEDKTFKIKLGDLIKSIEKNIMIYADMFEEEIEFSKQIENYDKVIYANMSNINECLIQLLNNAYEHKREKIRVEIKEKNKLEISVIDDGYGFDEKILGKSADLFVTSNLGRTSGKGYGVGLYYVKTYMDKISGELEVANGEDETAVKILIPMEDDYD